MPAGNDFVSLQGEYGFDSFCGLLLRAMGIMGYVEDIGRIVSPNIKNVKKDTIIASSFSLLNYNCKSAVLCDYLFIWYVF